MDSYTLKYILKDSSEEKEYKFSSKQEVLSFVRNLHRWVTTLEWNPVYWLEAFSSFQIWLLNYAIDGWGWTYYDFLPWDESNPIKVSDEPWFQPIDGDVTNEILDEVNFSSKDKNMEFKNNILRVYWDLYTIKKETKLRDLLEILFSSNDKFMSYEGLKEIYSKWNFQEILESDFYYEWVRGVLKRRMSQIKEESKLNENIFSISVRWITKNI